MDAFTAGAAFGGVSRGGRDGENAPRCRPCLLRYRLELPECADCYDGLPGSGQVTDGAAAAGRLVRETHSAWLASVRPGELFGARRAIRRRGQGRIPQPPWASCTQESRQGLCEGAPHQLQVGSSALVLKGDVLVNRVRPCRAIVGLAGVLKHPAAAGARPHRASPSGPCPGTCPWPARPPACPGNGCRASAGLPHPPRGPRRRRP